MKNGFITKLLCWFNSTDSNKVALNILWVLTFLWLSFFGWRLIRFTKVMMNKTTTPMNLQLINSFALHGNDQLVMVPETFFEFISNHFGIGCIIKGDPAEHSIMGVLSDKHAGSTYRLYFTLGDQKTFCLFVDNKPYEFLHEQIPA
jgi:hypothetical protein